MINDDEAVVIDSVDWSHDLLYKDINCCRYFLETSDGVTVSQQQVGEAHTHNTMHAQTVSRIGGNIEFTKGGD